MRIASLVPSTTEIVAALGLGDQLVARTHECDYPPEVAAAPAVTRDLLPGDLSPAQIDAAVAASTSDAHTIYALDATALRATRPDVVLTQATCAVCAVDSRAVATCSLGDARVISYDPATLDDILEGIREMASKLDASAAGKRLVDGLRDRLAIVAATRSTGVRPRVAAVEWPDPVYAPGHWLPDMVEAAGGLAVFGTSGERSIRATVGDLCDARPDVVILAFCGYDLATTERMALELSRGKHWRPVYDLGVPVVCVDGSAHFSRPGPRVVDGIEYLAQVLRMAENT